MNSALDDLKDKLLRGQHSSLTITYNDHAADYMSFEDYYTDPLSPNRYSYADWVSADEKKKAIENNSHWILQWYPDTPIGSCAVMASSFSAILDYLNKIGKK